MSKNFLRVVLVSITFICVSACGPKPCSAAVKKTVGEGVAFTICNMLRKVDPKLDCAEFEQSQKSACEASGALDEDCKISAGEAEAMAKDAIMRIADKSPLLSPMKPQLMAKMGQGIKGVGADDGMLTKSEYSKICRP